LILAIDFDETLHDRQHPKPGMKMGRPMLGAVEAMQALKAAGNMLIVHTFWPTDRQQHVRDWLDYYKIPWDDVTNVKPNAAVFLDDRAVRFTGDWATALDDIYKYGT
jgi:hypothetical protein